MCERATTACVRERDCTSVWVYGRVLVCDSVNMCVCVCVWFVCVCARALMCV